MSNVNAEIKMQGNNDAWFTTNAAVVYPANVVIYHTDGRYKYTDGVTALSALTFRGAGGSATWGGITGTLSNQTDLQTVLNNKEPLKGSDDNYVTDAQLVVISNTSGTNTGNETAATIGAIVNGATNYTPPLDADKIGIWDVANGLFKSLTLANLKTTLAILFGRHIFYMYSDTSSGNPLDNSVYYTSILNAVAVQTTNVIRFNSPKNNCVFGIQVGVYVTGTLGSSENTVVKIQNVTSSTEETLTALQHNKRYNQSYTMSTLANTAGDEMVVQITNPAWATNPLSCQYQFTTFGY